uniref:Uncharacterized protein n=2 Tax=Nothobranchius kuhntae TaxID=321403 RepID=A0A1A8JA45_NOTKU
MVTKSQLSNGSKRNKFFSASTMDAGNSFPILNDDLEPGKAGVCPGSDGHISQIPGLSPTVRSLPEEKARGRRVGVQESDSDYVKLAKQGGHKGLLWHDGTITSKLTSYKTPDWFSNESGDSNKQSKDKKIPGAQQPLKPPFWTENVTARERGDGCSNKDKEVEDVDDLCDQQVEQFQSPIHFEASKYKRTVFDKKPAPVDMSKLLRFGYAEENKPVQ